MVFDPLLVQYLARELDERLRGRGCSAAPLFASGRTVTLPLQGGEALQLDLHPTRGWVRLVPWEEEGEEIESLCTGVSAPPDERRIEVHLNAADRFRVEPRRLVVELHSNQWNALLVSGADERILSAAWSRAAGERSLRPGTRYAAPTSTSRTGADEIPREDAAARWREVLTPLAPAERPAALVRHFAYTGTLTAAAILGEAAEGDDPEPLETAFARWWSIRALPAPAPGILYLRGRWVPYPLALPGVERRPIGSLLEGMDVVSEEPARADADEGAALLAPVRRHIEAARRRVERLREQLAAAGDHATIRAQGDLLLANFHAVKRGDREARLLDWEGEPVTLALDPALSVADNAARLYDRARRRERAEARIPGLVEEAERRLAQWLDAAVAMERGEPAPGWVSRSLEREGTRGDSGRSEGREATPYRIYRTSGGLEVRVGRSAKENDRLTFAHSSPGDLWLHAQSVPGSHVILRWNDPNGAPPGRDLEEAAGLAAWYSKARSSTLVPVDFTRRKYVRKPRGAPPGAVALLRAKTLFVEPDAALEERMREE